jgi:hypothetical protein
MSGCLSIKLPRGIHSTSTDRIRMSSSTDWQVQTSVQSMSPPVSHWKNLFWMRLLQAMFKSLIGKPKDVSGIILNWTAMMLRQDLFGRLRGTRWLSWSRHCPTCREFVGSIPDGFTGIFHLHYPSCGTMALGSAQHLKEISARNISWG